jgi:hypothetical protein
VSDVPGLVPGTVVLGIEMLRDIETRVGSLPRTGHELDIVKRWRPPLKTTVLFSAFAVIVLFASQAAAGGGGPSQLMPPYPYPSYCEPCRYWDAMPPRHVVAPYRAERRRTRANATSETSK